MYLYDHSQCAASIAIVSDTHGQVAPAIVEIVRACDLVIHGGDICGASVLSTLQATGKQVYGVRGNNDRSSLWSAAEQAVLDDIPETLSLKLPGGLLVMEHGHRHGAHQPCHQSLRRTHSEARVIVYGHTHKLLIDQSEQPWIVNPGAAGFTRNRGGPSCLVLRATMTEWCFETYQFPDQVPVMA